MKSRRGKTSSPCSPCLLTQFHEMWGWDGLSQKFSDNIRAQLYSVINAFDNFNVLSVTLFILFILHMREQLHLENFSKYAHIMAANLNLNHCVICLFLFEWIVLNQTEWVVCFYQQLSPQSLVKVRTQCLCKVKECFYFLDFSTS